MKANSRVLDIGCGSGALQVHLQTAKGCECIGLDIAADIFRGIRHLFVHADSGYLPFRHEVFDAVMTHQVMSHVRDPVGSLREQIRVTKIGGRVVMSDGNLLSPFDLFDFLVLYPLRTRGQRGGLKWLKRLRTAPLYRNYDGVPQKDEAIRSRFYWSELFNRLGLCDVVFPFKISYLATIYLFARKASH